MTQHLVKTGINVKLTGNTNKTVTQRIDVITATDALKNGDLIDLGIQANKIRTELHPENRITFVIDRNINYTNICESKCSFCAFYRDKTACDAYVLTHLEIFDKIAELVDQGGTQLLMQGGLNPDLGIEYFEDLFKEISYQFPTVQIHSLSPAEIVNIASNSNLTIPETILRLKAAGLGSVPGGGAEILVDAVRRKISPRKIGWRQWTEVMLMAANADMPTTATMMFGCGESQEDIIEHLFKIRDLQDAGASFTAFIPWTYQPGNTELGGQKASGVEYLKVLAVSRIVLDNIRNIQASWVTQGDKLAQAALFFGANDLGGTMLEENVVAAAGCCFRMSQDEMISIIREAGFRPAQRTTNYRIVQEF